MNGPLVTKGSRVRARKFIATKSGTYSLADVQNKLTGQFIDVTGVVKHIRGDDELSPKTVMVYIDSDPGTYSGELVKPVGCSCEVGHAEFNSDYIVGVL